MQKLIVKSIKDIKADVGVYFQMVSIFNDKYEENNLFLITHRLYFRSFKTNLDFWYDFATGKNKKSVFVEEKFCKERLEWLFSDGEMSENIEDIKENCRELVLKDFKNFVKFCRNKMTTKISKNKGVKRVLSLNASFKKMDYLISHEDEICQKKAEELFLMNVNTEYFNEEQMVFLPENWDVLVKKEKLVAYQVNDNGLKQIEALINNMSYDRKTNSMDIRIEVVGGDGYNIPFYHMEEGVYQFSNPSLFFEKVQAIKEATFVAEKMKAKMTAIEESIAC